MTTSTASNWSNHRNSLMQAIRRRFSLRDDKADDQEIDQRLRSGVEMRGTNLWVLMFAIFIASIGLNVNSTAVIIGAMLISPLMGPIMGIGYGVGISDFALIRKALFNLGVATLISLVTSTVYFLMTPLTTAYSELLARTTPSIWDVLIALFGGLAGIVATTRTEKSNVFPGVAIATALMPPLCTAGFGLANQNWEFVLGALYLFTINSVFIAFSSAVVVRAFRVHEREFVDARSAKRVHLYMGLVVTLTLLPSFYLAAKLVGDEVFRAKAVQFVRMELESPTTHVVSTVLEPKERRIQVTLVGNVVPPDVLAQVSARLPGAGLSGVQLKVFQTGEQRIDVAALKTNLLGDLYQVSQGDLERKNKTIDQLMQEVVALRDKLAMLQDKQMRFADLPAELHAIFPQITDVNVAESPDWNDKTGWIQTNVLVLNLRSQKPLRKDEQSRIEQWVKTRLKTDSVRVLVTITHK